MIIIATRSGKLRALNAPGIDKFAAFVNANNIPQYMLGNAFIEMSSPPSKKETPEKNGWVSFESIDF